MEPAAVVQSTQTAVESVKTEKVVFSKELHTMFAEGKVKDGSDCSAALRVRAVQQKHAFTFTEKDCGDASVYLCEG